MVLCCAYATSCVMEQKKLTHSSCQKLFSLRVQVVILLSPLLTFIRLLLTGQINKFYSFADGSFSTKQFMLIKIVGGKFCLKAPKHEAP